MSNKNILIIVFGLILASLFFVKSSNLNFDKKYDDLKISSISSALAIGNTIYSFSNNFRLLISAKGHITDEFSFFHSDGMKTISLVEKPSIIKFLTNAESIYIIYDGVRYDSHSIELLKGNHELVVGGEGFINQIHFIALDEYKENLEINLEFQEISKTIIIDGNVSNADIYFDNNLLGKSPLIYLFNKEGTLSIQKENYLTQNINIHIKDNDTETLSFFLKPKENIFLVESIPSLASVFVDNEYQGLTPININNRNKKNIKLSLDGYLDHNSAIDQLAKGLSVKLIKDMIPITFNSNVEAEIYLNNKKIGVTPLTVEIQKISNEIQLKKSGYVDQKFIFVPSISNQVLDMKLLTIKEYAIENSDNEFNNSLNKTLKLFEPGKVLVGSQSNQSRRSPNEVPKNISISRHFYVSKFLVTESEYSKFKKINNTSNLPVTNISWTDAAQFCNWLSLKEGLKPFYIFNNDVLVNYDLSSTGYRMLTEAEWTYIIKSEHSKNFTYPWGNETTLGKMIGNLADVASKGKLKKIIDDYDDGYDVKSPVGHFKYNNNGVFDMVGNVSEFVTDFYSVEYHNPNNVLTDYLGPMYGSDHVVKGSNFQTFSSNQLGTDYRAAASGPSDIIGFRIAKWIY